MKLSDDFALILTDRPPRERAHAAEAVRNRLARVPGVQKAVVIEERPERVFLEFDLPRLLVLGLSAPAVFEAIDAHNRLLPAGQIETRGPWVYLRLDADLADLETLRAAPIRAGEHVLRLGEIATVHRGYEEPPPYLARVGGEDAVVRRARPVVLTGFWGPMAHVLIGGLASSTLIPLFAVPALSARGFTLPAQPPPSTQPDAATS